MCVNSRPLSATSESTSQTAESSKHEPDAANGSRASPKQLQDTIESLSKENESLSKKVADFQVFTIMMLYDIFKILKCNNNHKIQVWHKKTKKQNE